MKTVLTDQGNQGRRIGDHNFIDCRVTASVSTYTTNKLIRETLMIKVRVEKP